MSTDVFSGTCFLHLQGQRISQASNQHEEGNKQSSLLMEKSGLHRKQKGTIEFPLVNTLLWLLPASSWFLAWFILQH
jgi:hypothetical protein